MNVKYMFTLGPLGLKPCKDNTRKKYHSYDLVFDKTFFDILEVDHSGPSLRLSYKRLTLANLHIQI